MDQSGYSLLNDDVLQNPDFLNLLKFVENERITKVVYPPQEDVYNAFCIPIQNVKVLILGQDPYHGKGQAHGYSFSVRKGVALPPSLKNIFKEAKIESSHGDLTTWTTQGVMLLNTVLTVEENKPKSHSRKGWQMLTRKVLELLIEHNECLVVMLWGRDAQNQVSNLKFKPTQLVLKAAHPSPLGAHHNAPVPFIGCGHFEQANQHLDHNLKEKIVWNNI